MPNYRIGADIGGTFTDIVLIDEEGNVLSKKVSSSVENYASAIIAGITDLFETHGIAPGDVAEILHGTTVASNAILELKGARVGLIGTKGFRDVLEIRNLRMPRLYDLTWQKPAPLVERYLRMTVDERIDANGAVETPLDRTEAEAVVDRLLAENVEAIAICLINSYANPAHEQLLLDVIRDRAPDLPVSASIDVLPEIKEYERTSTTVVNAYVLPIVSKYLQSLEQGFRDRDIGAPLLLMQSNGGLTPAEEAARKPVNIVESGPAGGVVGAHAVAKGVGKRDVISFDMGGTTAKASLIEDGAYTRSQEYSVGGGIMIGSRLLTGSGYLLKVPAIDLAEVGAGGGSIIWIDAGGALKIGPQSAGAMPGPVCYDQGGTDPTVTDANLVLGYLNPDYLCGGDVKLDKQKSIDVLTRTIAEPMGISLERAALGARQIAISNMIRAIRAVSSERGRDPRAYTLLPFGGNGALFAAGMAEELGMKTIIIPPSAGLFSALGLLFADVEHHYSRTVNKLLRTVSPETLSETWSAMETQAAAQLAKDGFATDRMQFTRTASMHYKGQVFELSVPVPGGSVTAETLRQLETLFGEEHERTYGHRAGEEEPVELVNAQLVGLGVPDRPRSAIRLASSGMDAGPASASRSAYFGEAHGWLKTPVLARPALAERVDGPAIVEEYDTTVLIPPGASAELDDQGNILMQMG